MTNEAELLPEICETAHQLVERLNQVLALNRQDKMMLIPRDLVRSCRDGLAAVVVHTRRPADAERVEDEPLANRAMAYLVACYGQPQSGRFVNWQARPEEIACAMADFTQTERDGLLAQVKGLEQELAEYREMIDKTISIEFETGDPARYETLDLETLNRLGDGGWRSSRAGNFDSVLVAFRSLTKQGD